MKDRVGLIIAAAVAVLHLAVANRYDLFRDELYFIVCGQHPAFGYADQPPLVPALAGGLYALGGQTWMVRLPAVFAAAALVLVVVAFVRLLGGGDGAAWIGGVMAAAAPMLMGLTATLNTTTFEPLAWTLIAYGLTRALLLEDRRSLLWTGVVAGFTMEAKYALPLWLLGLAVGLALLPERRIFRYRELWIGFAIAFVIALPSVIWQAAHGFPFAELVRMATMKDLHPSPLAFGLNQVFVMGPLFAPIWLTGLCAPFFNERLKPGRFLSIAFVFCAIATIAGGGKDYYLASAYPPLFALGAVAFERAVRDARPRMAYLALATLAALAGAPLALPILDPPALVSYETALHVHSQNQERGDQGDAIPSTFADMLGWHDFVREVGAAYDSLPPAEREKTAILVENYGEAAALDLYGSPYHLPPALSFHNQYWYWGQRGQSAENVLRVQFNPERLKPYCTTMTILDTTKSKYARDFENDATIAFCRGIHPSVAKLWPSLKQLI